MAIRWVILVLAAMLSGCAATPNVPKHGTQFDLSGCPPLLNCVSSQSNVALYETPPIHLKAPLSPASWGAVVATVKTLPGAHLDRVHYGYIKATCYSPVFHFPDFLELKLKADGRSLEVRSQAMLGLYDFGVNRHRVELLRQRLRKQDLLAPRGG